MYLRCVLDANIYIYIYIYIFIYLFIYLFTTTQWDGPYQKKNLSTFPYHPVLHTHTHTHTHTQ